MQLDIYIHFPLVKVVVVNVGRCSELAQGRCSGGNSLKPTLSDRYLISHRLAPRGGATFPIHLPDLRRSIGKLTRGESPTR
jgi:hypothetical protein